MKINKILSILLVSLLLSCNAYKYNRALGSYKMDGITYDGTSIYYNGELAAELGSVEVAYDNGKIVYEVTFILTSARFNELAIPIIKLASQHYKDKNWEVEVELKNVNNF